MCAVQKRFNFILLLVEILFSQHCLFKIVPSPLCSLGTFIEDHLVIYVKAYWALYSVPLMYVSALMPVSHCFDYCCFVICFKIRKQEASSFVYLSQDCFGYSGFLELSYEFYDNFFYFCKKMPLGFL